MKKIVALGAIAALAGGMIFADEPAIDIKVAEFTGDASVSWGVDLDAGQHGFTNSGSAKMKINLWNEGTKEASGDGTVWAELKIKGAGKDINQDAKEFPIPSASLETAKLHFGDNFYIDIKSGDTKVGSFKPDTAIHSDYEWFQKPNAGLDFANGIQAGWDQEEFKFALDFRSYKADKTDKTSAYGIKLTAELKDKLVAGLSASAGLAYNLSTDWKDCADPTTEDTVAADNASLGNHLANIYDKDKGIATGNLFNKKEDDHVLAYAAQVAYKIGVGDDMFVKPSVGFRGSNETWKASDKAASSMENELAAGVLFGWGDINKDAAAGVPYLGDPTKKVSPGVGVVAYIPLPTVEKFDDDTTTTYDALKAMIVPSFYLGDKVTNLSAAAYAEIGLFNFQKPADKYAAASLTKSGYVLESCDDSTGKNQVWKGIKKENETTAIAFAAGIAYKIELDDGQAITPKAGFRYANSAYVANGLEGKYSNVFKNLGMQSTYFENAEDEAKKTYAGDFFNLNAGVDFGGFVNNTTFSVEYKSANLLNGIKDEKSTPASEKDRKYYNVKLGTLDVGCKISF